MRTSVSNKCSMQNFSYDFFALFGFSQKNLNRKNFFLTEYFFPAHYLSGWIFSVKALFFLQFLEIFQEKV